jgi:hypothetical protein
MSIEKQGYLSPREGVLPGEQVIPLPWDFYSDAVKRTRGQPDNGAMQFEH